MKESPFAPLEAWLTTALGHQIVRSSLKLPRIVSSIYPTPYDIDLRDLQTRAAVLRALHDVGISRPWALGAPWSPLTDEQAGRATAAILRAVGADPSKPAGVVPVCVLGEWRTKLDRGHWRDSIAGPHVHAFYSTGWHVAIRASAGGPPAAFREGFDRGPEAREPCEAAARALGCIMIEDITP